MSSRWSKVAGTLLLALATAGAQAMPLPPPGVTEGALIAAGRGGVHDSFASFNVSRLGGMALSKLPLDARLLEIAPGLISVRPGPIGEHRPDRPYGRVPEPATWAMLLTALAALAWVAQRRPARAVIKR